MMIIFMRKGNTIQPLDPGIDTTVSCSVLQCRLLSSRFGKAMPLRMEMVLGFFIKSWTCDWVFPKFKPEAFLFLPEVMLVFSCAGSRDEHVITTRNVVKTK